MNETITAAPVRKLRDSNMELLRILLMLMIVLVHNLGVTGLLGDVAPYSGTYYLLWWLEGLGCVSTNGFVLLAGYYLLNSRLTAKKVIKLWLQVFVYSAGIYAILALLGRSPGDWASIREAIFPLIRQRYWFISNYMALFLLSPVLNLAIRHLDRRGHFLFMALLLGLFSVIPSIFGRVDFLGVGDGYCLYWFVCLYVVGAYLRKYPLPKARWMGWGLVVWLVTALAYPVSRGVIHALAVRGLANEWDVSWLCMRNSVFNVAGSIGLFCFFCRLPSGQGRAARAVCRISPLVFGVYLIHMHPNLSAILWGQWIRPQEHVGSVAGLLAYLAGTTLAVFAACLLVEWLRQMIFRPLENSRAFERVCDRVERLCRLEWLYRLRGGNES